MRELREALRVSPRVAIMDDQSIVSIFDLDDRCVPCVLTKREISSVDEFSYTGELTLYLQIFADALVRRPVLSLAALATVSACLTTCALVRCRCTTGCAGSTFVVETCSIFAVARRAARRRCVQLVSKLR